MAFLFFAMHQVATMGEGPDYRKSVINRPDTSHHCDALLKRRKDNISLRQKATALILRNQKLQKIAPAKKRKVLGILQDNLRRLKGEKQILSLKIKKQEENIIRAGCQGIKISRL